MTNQDITKVKELLSTKKKIVIIPHKNPDGDAIGSSLGLYHYLKLYKHDVEIIAPNDYPDFLKWMPFENVVIKYESETKKSELLINNADIIFTLDFNTLERTGNMKHVLANNTSIKIMIDHHQQPDDYAKFMYSDSSMSSTCEMIYNFIEMLGDVNKINEHIATCLYTGIMTDTGSFRFRSTTSKTHNIIAQLINKGAKNSDIHNNLYDTNSFDRLQLLGCALSNLKTLPEYRTAYITLSQNELEKYNFKKGDTEGFVNYGLSLKDIKLAVIFIEDKKEGIIKMSFRSKGDFSVNKFAREHFNGGGHDNASGGRSILSLKNTVENFISILPQYKSALNHE